MLLQERFGSGSQEVGLKMNIARRDLAHLPANPAGLAQSDLCPSLSQKGWVAVETVIDEHVVRES